MHSIHLPIHSCMKRILFFCFVVWLIAPFVRAQTYYVTPTGGGTHDGSSWANAYDGGEFYFNVAFNGGGEYWVAQGTYIPGNASALRSQYFFIPANTQLYGGFVGNETALSQRDWKAHPTILSGDVGVAGDSSDNCYHILYFRQTLSGVLVDGFHITGGYNEIGLDGGGGAVFNTTYNANALPIPTVAPSLPTFVNCQFYDNYALSGGAVYNDASFGGDASASFVNCRFQGNSGGYYGGAVYNYAANNGYIQTALYNCLLTGNYAGFEGSAIMNYGSGGDVGSKLVGCTVAGNFNYSTVASAIETSASGGANLSVFRNSIIWGNQAWAGMPAAIFDATGSSLVENCIVEGGFSGGTNVSSADPKFLARINPLSAGVILVPNTEGDYRLAPNSPAINAGDSTLMLSGLNVDFAGNDRVSGSNVDLGCYETTSWLPNTATIIYVNHTATGANNGSSWTDAFTDLRSALTYARAAAYNSQVWVAGGTYRPAKVADRLATFEIPSGALVYGGFSGIETQLNQRPGLNTTLSGDLLANDSGAYSTTNPAYSDNACHVVHFKNADYGTTLDYFTIQSGNASIAYNGAIHNYGGGILNETDSTASAFSIPFVENCYLYKNTAFYGGGGAANVSAKSGTAYLYLNQTVLDQNLSLSYAGGGGVLNFADSAYGAISLYGCTFFGDSSATAGGGICNYISDYYGSGDVYIESSIIEHCRAAAAGGAIQNITPHKEAAVYLVNTTVAGNDAPQTGFIGSGAIYNSGYAQDSALIYARNSIIWNNSGSIYDNGAGKLDLERCLIEGDFKGKLVRNLDPKFTSPKPYSLSIAQAGAFVLDYSLTQCSPAIDAGDSTVLSSAKDLFGGDRIRYANVDLGAYEYYGTPYTPTRVYVKANATGANNGTSWADAYTNLQSALNGCPASEIWVANGVYKPTASVSNRDATFSIPSHAVIMGGFLGTETSAAQRPQTPPLGGATGVTILSGDINSDDVLGDFNQNRTDNVYHVVTFTYADSLTSLDNVFISGGQADGSFEDGYGSAIFNDARYDNFGSPTISYCSIRENYAGSGTISNIANWKGKSNLRIFNTRIQSNGSYGGSGGIYNRAEDTTIANVQVHNTLIANNNGAGIWSYAAGGAEATVDAYGITVSGNYGNALYAENDLSPNASSVITAHNSILWGDLAEINTNNNATVNVDNSIVQGGYVGVNNQNADPLFDAPITFGTLSFNGGYTLPCGSPAVNAGANGYISYPFDVANNQRVFGSAVDLGCYESAGTLAASLGADVAICAGASTTLTANVSGSSAPTILWNTGASSSTLSVSPTATTSYSVEISDNGCTVRDTILVSVNANPTAATIASIDSICVGATVILTGSGNGGSGSGYSGAWSNGVSSYIQSVSPTATTDYAFTLTDGNGCAGKDTITITVGAGNLAVNLGADAYLCPTTAGNNLTVFANPINGTGSYSYLWDDGTNNTSSTKSIAAGANVFSVTITDPTTNCIAKDTITYTAVLFAISLGNDSALCTPNVANLPAIITSAFGAGSAGFSYQWNPAGSGANWSGTLSLGNNQISVTATDNASGCMSRDTVTYVYSPAPARAYVNAAAVGSNDGTSWANAFTSLQSAMTATCYAPEIWVAAGDYFPSTTSDRSAHFALKPNMKIYGGFTGTETALSQRPFALTTLNGDIGVTGDTADNSYCVVKAHNVGTNAALNDVWISGGNASGSSLLEAAGMAISAAANQTSSPDVVMCNFISNNGRYGGGAMSIFASGGGIASPRLDTSVFQANSCVTGGAGIVATALFNGKATPHAKDLSLLALNATGSNAQGGAISLRAGTGISGDTSSEAHIQLSRSYIEGSQAVGGGAIAASALSGDIQVNLDNTAIVGNLATNVGAIYSAVAENADANIAASFRNCTFATNNSLAAADFYQTQLSGGTASAEMLNSIFWGNSHDLSATGTGQLAVSNSIVQGGFAGVGNLNADPLFNNPIAYNVAPISGAIGGTILNCHSPAINAGNSSLLIAADTLDARRKPRVFGSAVDMGAFEQQADPISVSLGNDLSQCSNSTLLISLTPLVSGGNPSSNFVYQWNNGSTSGSLTLPLSGGGQVSVMVTDTSFVGGCSASDTINYTVLPAPTVNVGADIALCQGGTNVVTANIAGGTPPTSLQWSNGSVGNPIFVTANGGTQTIAATVTDANGCTATDTMLFITNQPPPAPVIFRNVDTLSIATPPMPVSIVWYFNNTAIAGANGTSLAMTQNGLYTACISAVSNGCTTCDTIVVTNVGIADAPLAAVRIFPNPTSGRLTLQASEPVSVHLYDAAGRLLLTQSSATETTLFDLSPFAAGVYTLRLRTASGAELTQKVVKVE